MNKIEQMVKEMCPGGVEKVKLVQYCNVLYGFPFESQYFSEDSSLMPIIRIRDVVPGVASTYYSGAFMQEFVVKKGDILVGMDGNFNLAKWKDRDGLLNQRVCKLYTKNDNMLIDGFIYHFMKPEFKRIELNTPGGSVKHLSAKIINSIEIPLPPLPIQEAIVEILDKFESLQQGLEDELQARKKQYEYYRNKLLTTFPDNVEVKECTLGELGTITRGKRFVRNDIQESGMPCIHYGDMYTYYGLWGSKTRTFLASEFPKKMRYAQKNDVVIVGAGENDIDIGIGLVWENDVPAAVHDACYILRHNINGRFISHYLRTHYYHDQIRKHVNSAKISSFSAENLGKTKILVPSIDEQNRIVSILDHFETLVNDKEKGIPAEIAAVKAQYEYYRNKLLTF